MEPAKIDWKRLEWKFVEDELYEHINAPKWVDFMASDESLDDEAWFCRPDCKHPMTVEDFLRSTPSKSVSSPNVSETLPFGDQNKRDVKLYRGVPVLSSASPDGKRRFNQDSENQNPNMSTPLNNHSKFVKVAFKSSEKKKNLIDDTSQSSKVSSLKSTLSAKNLLGGRPILNQITEFCNELKKLATRERENVEDLSAIRSEDGVQNASTRVPHTVQVLGESGRRERERKPLLEVGKAEKSEGTSMKGKQQRIKRLDEAENIPISLDLENARHKREENLLQLRTNPPSPQGFSATRGPNKTTPSKASKSRLMERGLLKELEQNKEVATELPANNSKSIAIDERRGVRALDMFWFLKPCTLSG